MYSKDNKINYNNIEVLESHYFTEIPYRETDDYLTVTVDLVNRLDLVSYDYYGTVRFWNIIAQASNIINPLDVPVGTVLRIPKLYTLYSLGIVD